MQDLSDRSSGPVHAAGVLFKRLSASSFFRNLASLSGAALLNRILGLVTLGWAARHLGPENYGKIGFGLSIAAYAALLLSPGLQSWGVRAIAQDRTAAGRLLIIVNGAQILLSFLGFTGATIFAFHSMTDPAERSVVILSALMLFVQALSADWVLNGLEMARYAAGFGVIVSLLSSLGLIFWVRQPSDLLHVPILAFLSGIAGLAGSYWVLLRHLKLQVEWPTRAQTVAAVRASLPLGLLFAIVVVLHYANNLIVRGFLGERELGVYLSGYRLVEQASLIPTILAGAFFPRLARTVVGARDQAGAEARLFARVHIVPGMLIAVMMLTEAPTIVRILYGDKYTDAVNLIRVMAPAVLFNYAICGYTNCLISYGRERVLVLVTLVSAVVAIGGGLILVPILGSMGAAIAIAFVDLSGWLVSLPAYRKEVGSLQLVTWRAPLLGAVVVAAVTLGLQHLNVPWPVRIPLALCAYLPFVYQSFKDVLQARNSAPG